jgi:FK506-binding nuclear protein
MQSNGKLQLNGKPLKFKLGKGEVMKGLDVGLEGIKLGGKRRLTIPAEMAFAASRHSSRVPRNATLLFDVVCKLVN